MSSELLPPETWFLRGPGSVHLASPLAHGILDRHNVVVFPTPIYDIIRNEGISLYSSSVLGGQGLAQLDIGRIVFGSTMTPQDTRMALAHELGHFATAQKIATPFLDEQQISELLTMSRRDNERLCDAFSAYILVPDALFHSTYTFGGLANVPSGEIEQVAFELQVPVFALRWRIREWKRKHDNSEQIEMKQLSFPDL